jgi:hypothetical protein
VDDLPPISELVPDLWLKAAQPMDDAPIALTPQNLPTVPEAPAQFHQFAATPQLIVWGTESMQVTYGKHTLSNQANIKFMEGLKEEHYRVRNDIAAFLKAFETKDVRGPDGRIVTAQDFQGISTVDDRVKAFNAAIPEPNARSRIRPKVDEHVASLGIIKNPRDVYANLDAEERAAVNELQQMKGILVDADQYFRAFFNVLRDKKPALPTGLGSIDHISRFHALSRAQQKVILDGLVARRQLPHARRVVIDKIAICHKALAGAPGGATVEWPKRVKS